MTTSTPEPNELHARVAEAVGIATIPTLACLLVQLGGDRRWIEGRFVPTRTRGLEDNDTGGLPTDTQDEIRAAWQTVYENIDTHWELYELAEKLVDLEDYFRRWRFNHVTTVERVIGFKRGTGGTSGVQYLRRMLEVELFPELWHLRGDL